MHPHSGDQQLGPATGGDGLRQCLEGPDECAGPVEYRLPGYGDIDWPRCERHGRVRVASEQQAMIRYPDQAAPPTDFDPADAGQRWEPDD